MAGAPAGAGSAGALEWLARRGSCALVLILLLLVGCLANLNLAVANVALINQLQRNRSVAARYCKLAVGYEVTLHVAAVGESSSAAIQDK